MKIFFLYVLYINWFSCCVFVMFQSLFGMFVYLFGVEKFIYEWIDDLVNLYGEGKEKQFRIWLDRVLFFFISLEIWIVKFDKYELFGKIFSFLSYYF